MYGAIGSYRVNSVVGTADGGVIAGGNNVIRKYSADGKIEWSVNNGKDVCSVAETADGGVIAGGDFQETTQVGDKTYTSKGGRDGIIVKYSAKGEVEWASTYGGNSEDMTSSVAETIDGNIIAGGYFRSSTIEIGENIYTSKGNYNGIIVKYGEKEVVSPKITSVATIGGNNADNINSIVATSDGGYIVGGFFVGTIKIGDKTYTSKGNHDGIIIKYGATGEIEWSTSFGTSASENVYSIVETKDGSYIVGGYFGAGIANSFILKVGDYTLTSKSIDDGLLIKYSSEGEVEWATSFGGNGSDYISSVALTSDGGYIVGGSFSSSEIQLGDYILKNNWSTSYNVGLLIKYSSEDKVEWAKAIGGSDDVIINSVVATSDGGYIAGGSSTGTITIGNKTYTSQVGRDGIIIKYNAEGKEEWSDSLLGAIDGFINSVAETADGGVIAGGVGVITKYSAGGSVEWVKNYYGGCINSVEETTDGGVITGGYFSGTIEVGDKTYISKGNTDGIIIKCSAKGEVEWSTTYGGNSEDVTNSVAEIVDGGIVAGGHFESRDMKINEKSITNKGYQDGIILKVVAYTGVPEIELLSVKNERKEFKITTDIQEIDEVKGGSISGEDESPYEKVKYGDNSTKEIMMIPDENYEIIGITVNREEWPFTANEDGTYIMPRFENITENKHIVVTYSLKNNKITVNKVDSKTKEPISGVRFKLDQIEERTEPKNVIGNLTDNGYIYREIEVTENEITGVLGELTNNGTYYFEQQENGTYIPTNGKTYQLANGGTGGKHNTTANSYIPIDLTGKEGTYAVVVNAYVSSEGADYGYATINQTTAAPTYNSTEGRFMYISGDTSAVTTLKDYTSMGLQGGNIYYLHLGYRKDGSVDKGEDQVVINSIKVYEAEEERSIYNFIDEDGKYKSSNQGQANTVSNSYIPIDLTECSGTYKLIVNAEVSSQISYDYGYATVTTDETRPAYYNSTGRFIYISGAQEAKDYTTVIEGGQKYYLHLGYYKNAATDSGSDTFTVNNVKIELNEDDLYHVQITTNSEGQAITQIPFGKYTLTEVNTPEGYQPLDKPVIIEFKGTNRAVLENENKVNISVNDNGEFTVENILQDKVIVHHYLKDRNGNYTTTKLAEDDMLYGNTDEKYVSQPHLDLEKYDLEKDGSGNYIIPQKATGVFKNEAIEIIYYYEEKKTPITVYHYIEGTMTPVPLAEGLTLEDLVEPGYTFEDNGYKSNGYEGDNYTTSAIPDEKLSAEYELLEIPANANGKYAKDAIEVNYYYKRAKRDINIIKYAEDGKTPLEGVKFDIRPKGEVQKPLPKVDDIVQNGTFGFKEENGKFVSNNKGHSTASYSYIKVDLTGVENTVVKINAEISSEANYDMGYVTVTETTSVPTYNKNNNYFIKMSGTKAATDYETELEGGKVYYIHFAYEKDGSNSRGTDTFTINSIQIGNNEKPKNYTYVTDSNGRIRATVETGEYEIVEIETLEGYVLPENPTINVVITKDMTEKNIEITNEKIKGTVIVHHYIIGTENPVQLADGTYAKDETKQGYIGDIYATKALENIAEKYEYASVIGNTSGEYAEGVIEVTYYYQELQDIDVIKKWDHTDNIYGTPENVTIELYADGEKVNETTMTKANKITVEGETPIEETWKYTFERLPKYNAEGTEINYTISEKK